MFLQTKISKKHTYLYLVESYRDGGPSKQRILERYGRIDRIPTEKLQALQDMYGNDETRELLKRAATAKRVEKELEKAAEAKAAGKTCTAKLRYGHLMFRQIWNEELGLYAKLNAMQKRDTDITSYQINDIAYYLASLKVIDPSSQLKAFRKQSLFLGSPIDGIHLDNIYRTLEYLGNHKGEIMAFAAKRTMEKAHRKPKMIFYDCTNCYFEAPYDDAQKFTHNFKKEFIADLKSSGVPDSHIGEVISSQHFKDSLNKALQEAEKDGLIVRMRGKSKEMRYDLPIISVALIIDDRGIPLDFQVFKGNTSEYKTMEKSIEEFKEKYGVQDCYVVADRGLNSAANLQMLQDKGYGFVVAQKVSKQKADIRRQMLDQEGYKTFDTPESELDVYDSALGEALRGIRYKIIDITKETTVKQPDGSTKSVNVKCKMMFTFSEKRRARDLAQLEDSMAKARSAIKDEKLMGRVSGSGWQNLVETVAEQHQGKEDKQMYRAAGIKQSVYEDRMATAGYAAVVFAPSAEDLANGKELTDEEILFTYHHLVRIEECFRIMKHNFSIRPMFVRKLERIVGHCLVCVLALIMIRLTEMKLAENGYSMSVDRIAEALGSATVTVLDTGSDNPVFINNKEFSNIFTLKNIGKNCIQAGNNDMLDINQVVSNYLKESDEGSDLEILMRALGFKPLPDVCTAKTAAACLRTRLNNRKAIFGTALSLTLGAKRAL